MKNLLLMIFSMMVLTLAGCVTAQKLKVNELKTNDGDIYYREGVVLNTCYARAKKDVTVTLNGVQIKACQVTRAYSDMGPTETGIFEIDCSKVNTARSSANCN